MAKKNSEEQTTEQTEFQLTRAIQDVVKKEKRIKNVFFDEFGNVYFTKHEVTVHEIDENGYSVKASKVDALPGVTMGLCKLKDPSKRNAFKDAKVCVGYKAIAFTMTREEALAATPVSNKKTEKEKLEILAAAAEIAKGGDFDSLMEKIKAQDKK